jgi:hypothetical protein
MWMIYLWIAIVIGFVNDFVIEKGIGKVGPTGAGRRGRAAGGVGPRACFSYFEKITLVPSQRATGTNY